MFATANFWLRFVGPLVLMVGIGLAGALHAATRPDSSWKALGQPKLVWVIVNALFWPAAILYFLFVATRLKRSGQPHEHQGA